MFELFNGGGLSSDFINNPAYTSIPDWATEETTSTTGGGGDGKNVVTKTQESQIKNMWGKHWESKSITILESILAQDAFKDLEIKQAYPSSPWWINLENTYYNLQEAGDSDKFIEHLNKWVRNKDAEYVVGQVYERGGQNYKYIGDGKFEKV